MIRVIINGCNGRMGQAVAETIGEFDDIQIAAGIDVTGKTGNEGFPVYAALGDCKEDADVCIDFSHHEGLPDLLVELEKRKLPAVIATTGFSEDVKAQIERVSESVALFQAANMSMGVNLIKHLVSEAAKVLLHGFDIEIVEKHHNKKKDAPSGTALALADSINEARGKDLSYVFGRKEKNKLRETKELGIHAVRGGSIVGDHDVLFAGKDEVVTISHRAYSRRVFAAGAVGAARFLVGKEPGLYSMDQVISGE
ncbi:MAG: 4-hydroxy-tetrahydrodipicolinate reductase, partial [Sediminispirochaetaceae bacterium]